MFEDRLDAADRLVDLLAERDFTPEVVVAIPRGGVPIGHRVAGAFGIPLVVLSVKKVGAPSNPEFAIGAVTDGDVVYLDERAVRALGLDDDAVERACEEALEAARERARRLGLSLADAAEHLRGKTAVVVDDGLATGATVRACCRQVQALGATSQVVAVPVASPRAVAELREEGRTVLAVETPPHFSAVSQSYASFPQVEDDEVRALLSGADSRRGTNP